MKIIFSKVDFYLMDFLTFWLGVSGMGYLYSKCWILLGEITSSHDRRPVMLGIIFLLAYRLGNTNLHYILHPSLHIAIFFP